MHDKSNLCRIGAGSQFGLPDLILWTVVLNALLGNYSKVDDVFRQVIDVESGIRVPWFSSTSAIVIPLSETSPI